MVEQRYVRQNKGGDGWLLGRDGSGTFLGSQHESELEKMINMGWIVKHVWEDACMIVIILERGV